jgi:hypothetical protein
MGLTVNFSKWGLMTVLELVLNARMLAESKGGQSPMIYQIYKPSPSLYLVTLTKISAVALLKRGHLRYRSVQDTKKLFLTN